MSEEKKTGLGKRLLPLIILVVVAVVLWIFARDYLTPQVLGEERVALRGWVESNTVLAVFLFMLVYAVVVAASLPGGAILTITGGFLFGIVAGGLATVIGATAGACVLFMVARSAVGEALAARVGPWLEKLRAGFQDNALSYLLFLRLVPAFPFWLVNLAPAFLGVNVRVYVLGTFFGIMPGTFAFASVGNGLGSIFDSQDEACRAAGQETCTYTLSPSELITIELVLAFVALGVVALIPVAVKRLRRGKS